MRQKYKELEEQLTTMAIEYKNDIASLSRRIDVISPFLCGVVGCLRRKRANIKDDDEQIAIDDDGNITEG